MRRKEQCGLASCPDEQHHSGKDEQGDQYWSSDLVLFSFLWEMAVEVVVAHGEVVVGANIDGIGFTPTVRCTEQDGRPVDA